MAICFRYGKQAAASQTDIAAKHLRQLDTQSKETAVQAHVFQGREPTYFCRLFVTRGLILYRHIGMVAGNKGQRLFHVTVRAVCRACSVPCVQCSMCAACRECATGAETRLCKIP